MALEYDDWWKVAKAKSDGIVLLLIFCCNINRTPTSLRPQTLRCEDKSNHFNQEGEGLAWNERRSHCSKYLQVGLGGEREHVKGNPNWHIKLTDKSMSVKVRVI